MLGSPSLLLGLDDHLSPALEEILRDAILTDVSDYGIDLAVRRILPSYQPSIHRWEQLQYPNGHWLTSKTQATMDQPSQTVHINLLSGEPRIAGRQFIGFPYQSRYSLQLEQIFGDVNIYHFDINWRLLTLVSARLLCHTLQSPRNGFDDSCYNIGLQGNCFFHTT